MIENEQQRQMTQEQIARFRAALAQFDALPSDVPMHPALREAQRQGLQSILLELQDQLADYDAKRLPSRKTARIPEPAPVG